MNPTDTPNDTPTSGRKRTASIGLAAGLLAGGAIGLVATMPSLTSAASDDSAVVALQEDTTEESGESVDVGPMHRRIAPRRANVCVRCCSHSSTTARSPAHRPTP